MKQIKGVNGVNGVNEVNEVVEAESYKLILMAWHQFSWTHKHNLRRLFCAAHMNINRSEYCDALDNARQRITINSIDALGN